MPSYEDRYAAAHEKFFAEHPEAQVEVESADVREVEALGVTMEQYCQQKRYEVFSKAARRRGLDLDEFVIWLVADSPQQAHEWRLRTHRRMADALGIEWNEYKEMNRIFE
ncbi:DUF6388 family protein [Pseudomonas sp. 148P]|uniref:DUF6388 family protein n=1 Tax=Pseudomonas ulcerans TaxID=3115852 RepID=A0ABU7HMX8_9PSED|nr:MULTISPECIES: DUF6388 family protein [unclassified Pseudomonas]MEE1921562.1 DUF6388 family protein [Pseudomonas sp. 147P]MEE1932880.1 DUF6388 family protein [Pseudomonas sp. 148P]